MGEYMCVCGTYVVYMRVHTLQLWQNVDKLRLRWQVLYRNALNSNKRSMTLRWADKVKVGSMLCAWNLPKLKTFFKELGRKDPIAQKRLSRGWRRRRPKENWTKKCSKQKNSLHHSQSKRNPEDILRKEMEDLNDMTNEADPIDMYWPLNSGNWEHIFLKVHGTSPQIDHILCYKENLITF